METTWMISTKRYDYLAILISGQGLSGDSSARAQESSRNLDVHVDAGSLLHANRSSALNVGDLYFVGTGTPLLTSAAGCGNDL